MNSDHSLRMQVLRAIIRDRTFLKSSWHDVDPAAFDGREEQIVAEAAIEFYRKYEEPVGQLVRSIAEDIALKRKVGSDGRKKIKELIDHLQGAKMDPVPVKALQDMVQSLKRLSFYSTAVEEIITAYEGGKLDEGFLAQLVDKAAHELSGNGFLVRDYREDLKGRIERRSIAEQKKYPLLLIDDLDKRIKAVGRGHLALWLAPFASGKGMAFVHTAIAYAIQGLNVLYIPLEDPVEEVEKRLDAALTGLRINQLSDEPKKVVKRFIRAKKILRGRIKLIDGTEGGWTVGTVEKLWEHERNNGFIADAILVDYDDEIVPEKTYKGENARRFEFADIYRRLRQMAAKTNTIVWTAAQAVRKAEGTKIITGKDVAEDISKIRKVFLAISIGSDKEVANIKHLYVVRHRLDASRFGVDIVSDFSRGLLYDREATMTMKHKLKHGAE